MTAMVLAPGSTIAERLNNAIVMLQRAAAAAPVSKGTKKAIKDLHDHWQQTWRESTTSLPLSKLKRYAQWYARGWALLPSMSRVNVPDPRALDVSLNAAIDDTLRAFSESAQAVAKAGGDSAAFVANEAAKMGEEIMRSTNNVVSALSSVADVAIILGVLYVGAKLLDTLPKGR